VSNSATAVDALLGTAGGRTVVGLSVQNADTAAATVTVQYEDPSVTRTIFSALLAAGDQLLYDEERGFYVLDSTGAAKQNASTPSTKLDSSENSFLKTDAGVKDLLVAAATARRVIIVVTVTTTFANGDGAQPTLTIGEEGGSATKFAAAAKFTGAAAGATFAFAGTLTSGKKLQGTLVAGTGTTETGAYTIDVIAVG
jgi:hypothetical protein